MKHLVMTLPRLFALVSIATTFGVTSGCEECEEPETCMIGGDECCGDRVCEGDGSIDDTGACTDP